MAKNSFKNSDSEKPEPASKKESSKKAAPATGRSAAIRAFLSDRRVQKIGGIFLTLFSVFLLLACVAHIFFHPNDEQLIAGAASEGMRYKNWMGSVGAHIAQFFTKNNFGIGAIFLPLIFFLWGVRIWLKKELLPFWKSVRLSVLAALYFPVLVGFFSHRILPDGVFFVPDKANTLVGGIGSVLTEWLRNTLGWSGTLMLLAFVAMAFVIFNFNHRVEQWWAALAAWWNARKDRAAKEVEEEPEPGPVVQAPAPPIKNERITPPVTPPVELALDRTAAEEEEEEPAPDPIPESAEEEQEELEAPVDEAAEEVPAETAGIADGELEVKIAEGEALDETNIEQTLRMSGPYDPKRDLSRYKLPDIELLKAYGSGILQIDKEELEANKNRIVETLNNYNIEIAKIKATIGPTVTLYEIVPAPGVRISRIKNLEDDIALSLSALGIRIIAPIPGKGTIGIEVPNSKPDVVSMRSLIASEKFQHAEMELPIVLGKTISNETFVTDLTRMPHLLLAGATGQGKSVGLNAILVSLLYKKHPAEIKFVLVDPKKVELTLFNKIERHFLAKLPGEADPIITDTQKVVKTLSSLCVEMENRLELLKTAGCRNIKEYNQKFVERRLNPENGHRFLPYIVLVVDEFADLIMTAGREVETPIARLAQLARAIGIHLIIATQRPSVNIITGVIKANFPARIAFRVTSKIDSRTILDSGGAEQLIGRGDMLFSSGNDLIRIQCGFVDTPEVEAITDYIGAQQGYPEAHLLPEVADDNALEMGNLADEDRDEFFEEAARIIVLAQQGSASLLQRKLKLGYNRAGRLIDQLESAGVIGPFEGSKARKVLIPDELSLEQFLKSRASDN